ncbi:shikimate dehydrogenase [Bacillus sp. AFS076308]|uniref:shikimate dehydrogenase n=1 Tax=unclassified Bacillus (in: firmicutes) TaxID=185979 RepID=UPI000BFA6ACC|nr:MULTISPECIES: shikimate dehydrogenase [unclassified Bacillus (in: firmicutes)]PFO03641.1 shikimate dehydrogenase [Bacillus sp. AFS076308]PGV54372.1 shikimate dehydrogenase [Bacillus sp. AFS037270]
MKKLFGVLGNPIGHSMSPVMHNDLFSLYNIDAEYLPFLVQEDELRDAVNGLRALGAGGFNVTVPHKSSIIPFLDEVDELAASIGAVNTVINKDGKLIGYNTDGLGFLKGLDAYLTKIEGQKILVIGAGGAARAIYFTLAKEKPMQIDIANRTLEKAVQLIEECPYSISSRALTLKDASSELGEYDLIIQTTMIGMEPNITERPITLEYLREDSVVCEIIYNPLETRILREAKSIGATVQNGIDMFVYQGALAFEKWTGIFPDIKRMKENVLGQLGGK